MTKNLFTKLIILFIWLVIVFSFSCKNPFSTRESPPPVGQEGDWNTPFSPSVVMQNLLNSYNQKIIGNFSLCLSDTFRFSAYYDSIEAASQGNEQLFENWDVSVEVGVTELLFATSRQNIDSLDFFLTWRSDPSQSDIIEDSTAIFYRDYTLYELVGSPPETTIFRGLATFHLEETALNWWSIYLWEDIPIENLNWADFKADFRGQF